MTKEEFESITKKYEGASFSNIPALNKNIAYIQSCDGGVFSLSCKDENDIPRIIGYHDGSSSIIMLDYYYEGCYRTNQLMEVHLTLDNIQAVGMMKAGSFKPESEQFKKETLEREYKGLHGR